MKQFALAAGLLALSSMAVSADTPEYRLPAGIEPQSQIIELHLDPSNPEYKGQVEISLKIDRPVERIGVNQVGLEFSEVRLSSATGDRQLQATEDDWERSWLSDGATIAPGEYALHIEFTGKHSTDSLGMHRVTFEDNDYIFTQMEAMYARRAFPLFDEPSVKIPNRMIINAPAGLTVIANTPEETREEKNGWQRVTFMETPPMSSYLFAYAVGPLDYAEIEGIPIPGRVYVPKGHADELGFVLRETPKILAALQDYFGIDYPYRKMDFVAVPEFAFGAMENPGLITYRTDLMMVGDEVSGNQAVNVLNVIAHELAHIWYGDLVTMAWWDDLWLNEAFATWMANTILEREYPDYETTLNLPQDGAFAADELTTSRAIRGTVRNNDEIFESVGLNYTKGHSLLRMLEHYVGHEIWQEAIRAYVKKYAWQNATERDLWAVVSETSGVDVSSIAGGFLNQPGFASISIDEDGTVRQRRYVREGLEVDEKLWNIPITVKYKADGDIRQTFMLLDGAEGSLDVPDSTDWIFPDAGGNGYYRWMTSADQFYNLIDDIDSLTEREKIALLDNTEALLNSGDLSMVDYLSVIGSLLKDPHPLVFLPALEKIKLIGEQFASDDNKEAFAAFIDASMSERYASTGLTPRDDDSQAVIQLRPRLVRTLGQFGSDEALLAEAAELVDTYLESPQSVQSQMALEAMRITALNDDGGRYEAYRSAYLSSESATQRSNILAATYFSDPEVVKRHLDFSLSDAVEAGDSLSGINFFAYVLDDHTVLYEWLDENLDALVAKAPSYYQPVLPEVLADSCEQENLDRLIEFFEARGDVYAKSLAKGVEGQQGCISRRDRHIEDFDQFMNAYAGD